MNPKSRKRRARKLREQHKEKISPEIIHGCLVKDWAPEFPSGNPYVLHANSDFGKPKENYANATAFPTDSFKLVSSEVVENTEVPPSPTEILNIKDEDQKPKDTSQTWGEYFSSWRW